MFKMRDSSYISKKEWQFVPKNRHIMVKTTIPISTKSSRDIQQIQFRRSQISYIGWTITMHGLEGEKQSLILYSLLDREPVEFLQHFSCTIKRWTSCNDSSSHMFCICCSFWIRYCGAPSSRKCILYTNKILVCLYIDIIMVLLHIMLIYQHNLIMFIYWHNYGYTPYYAHIQT